MYTPSKIPGNGLYKQPSGEKSRANRQGNDLTDSLSLLRDKLKTGIILHFLDLFRCNAQFQVAKGNPNDRSCRWTVHDKG